MPPALGLLDSAVLAKVTTTRPAGGRSAVVASPRGSLGVAWTPASGWADSAGSGASLAWLLANRRLTVRYERRADVLTAFLHLAALICVRKL